MQEQYIPGMRTFLELALYTLTNLTLKSFVLAKLRLKIMDLIIRTTYNWREVRSFYRTGNKVITLGIHYKCNYFQVNFCPFG